MLNISTCSRFFLCFSIIFITTYILPHLLRKIDSAGYLSPEVVFVDGTHIKENANLKKAVKKAIPKAAKTYEKQLMEEINEDRESHDKKPFDETKPPKGG